MGCERNPIDVNKGREFFMCATDFEQELGNVPEGLKVYASVQDIKNCRTCVSDCGIVAVRIEFLRVVEPGVSTVEDII